MIATPSPPAPVRRAGEYALLGLLALLWGSSYLFIKVAVTDLPPTTVIAARVTIAAVLLVAVMRLRGERLPWDDRARLFVQAILNSIGAWTLLAWGQQYVDSALASVLNSTSPIFVFLITVFLTRHEAAGVVRAVGCVLGLIGVVLVVGAEALGGVGRSVLGQLAVLAGAVLYAAAAIYGRRLAHLSPTAAAAGTMIWASVCLVPASLVIDRPWTLSPTPGSLAATLVLGVFSTAVALLVYFRLLRTLGSIGVASQSYLRAAVGVVLGITLLGETVSPTLAIGLGVALLGVVLINVRSAPRGSKGAP